MVVPWGGTLHWLASFPGLPHLQVLITCSMGSKSGSREDLGTRLVLISPNKMYWCCLTNVVAFRLWTQSCKSDPLPQRSERSSKFIQGSNNIASHDISHHCLSSDNSLENSDRELRHLSCYCRNCKNILLGKRAHFETGISRVHYCKIKVLLQNNCDPQWHLVWSGKNYFRPLGRLV